jgi:hypothetical protein
MALSIGISVGSQITVGDHQVRVKELSPPNLIVITIDGKEDKMISDKERTEIVPEVFVSTGGAQNRLAFEAPKSIRIKRVV